MLARLLLSTVNLLLGPTGRAITPQDVKQAFIDYNKFVSRRDCPARYEEWMFGTPLDQFPPEPPAPPTTEASVPVKQEVLPDGPAPSGSDVPEGAVEFGGDYVKDKANPQEPR